MTSSSMRSTVEARDDITKHLTNNTLTILSTILLYTYTINYCRLSFKPFIQYTIYPTSFASVFETILVKVPRFRRGSTQIIYLLYSALINTTLGRGFSRGVISDTGDNLRLCLQTLQVCACVQSRQYTPDRQLQDKTNSSCDNIICKCTCYECICDEKKETFPKG